MIRLSVSDLESWRYWRASEDGTTADLIRRLKHEEPPTPQMEAGRAFARFMERAQGGCFDDVEVDGWRFKFDVEGEIGLPPVRELKGEEVFETPVGPVLLVGKVDGLSGLVVHDQKLTERFDPEKYLDSLQWRAYLEIFRARRFVYDVFTGRYDHARREVTIYAYDAFHFDAYAGMRRDVARAVGAVAEILAQYEQLSAAPVAAPEEECPF